jgi:hypothetical protein
MMSEADETLKFERDRAVALHRPQAGKAIEIRALADHA